MPTPLANKRNIAILAHVNAGKTTLSERLLYFGSAIPVTGEVDEGLATMDYLDEEKRRGITIEAGVASYEWKGVRTTFLDTPGHVDFGAEVDFALRAVEGAVLVVSGVSGVESQTLAAWEKVRKAGVAPMVFVNKMDAPGADFARALEQMRVLFKTTPVVLSFPVLRGGEIEAVIDVPHETALFRQPGSPRALSPGEIPEYCYEEYIKYRQALIEFASRHDDRVLRAWVEGAPVEPPVLLEGVRAGLMAGAGVPVCAGSALRNAGVRQMLNAINRMLPAPVVPGDAEGSVGFVIKARWHPVLGKFFLAKIHSGRAARSLEGASFYRVFAEALEETDAPEDGDIVAVRTDRPLAAGANLGRGGVAVGAGYRPLLQARLEPEDAASYARADAVLRAVAETDPSIQIETDATTGGWIARTVGELQLDVFLRRLRVEHGCALRAGAPSVRLLERPRAGLRRACEGTARAFGAEATVAFTAESIENQDENHIEIPTGLPSLASIEEEVLGDCFRAFCVQGVLGRGEIAGLRVGVTRLEGEIRPIPAPLLAKTFLDSLVQGLKKEDFEVFEPIMNLEIIVPEEFCGAVLADLAARGGAIRKIDADGHNSIIFLEIPLEKVFGYATLLRSLSKGLGVFVLTYEKHGPKKELKNKG